MGTHQDQIRGFAKYNLEFNNKLFMSVAELSDSNRKKNMGAFFGSIHSTLNHILLADRIWLGRFAQAIPGLSSLSGATLVYEFSSLDQELCSEFTDLQMQRTATDKVIVKWAEELSDELLASSMRYCNFQGKVREHIVWVAAAHMFNHQTHHRGQITTLLNQLGCDPGVTDYIAYVS